MDASLNLPAANMRRGSRWYRQPPVAFRHGVLDLVASAWPGPTRPLARGLAPGFTPDLAFDSGRSALRFALAQLATLRPERRRVIVPAYTCWSVAAAIEYAGLEPVCCDLDPATLDFVPAALADCLREPALAVIPTHLLGIAPEPRSVGSAGADPWLIEDAAQASNPAGAILGGCSLRLVSTARGKPLSTAGGGFLEVADPDLVAAFADAWAGLPQPGRRAGLGAAGRALVMNVMIHPRLFWLPAAIPALHVGETHYPPAVTPTRLSACQRRLYARVRAGLPALREIRRRRAATYRDVIGGVLAAPQPVGTRAPDFTPFRYPVYLDRPWSEIAAADRRVAARAGIAPMYPSALMDLERVRRWPANNGRTTPGADWIANHLVTLPTHAGIGVRECDDVLAALATVNRGAGHGRA